MVKEDLFYSFNCFEHCQDSFFAWLFRTRNKGASDLKKGLFLLFCGVDTGDVESTKVEITNVEPQPKREDAQVAERCDLVVRGEINGETHVAFVEDKTNDGFKKDQMKYMLSMAQDEKAKQNNNANYHIVYCSSAWLTPQTITDIKEYKRTISAFPNVDGIGDLVFVFRKNLERLVLKTVRKSYMKRSDSMVGQYALFVCGIVPIASQPVRWDNSDFVSFFKKLFFSSNADFFFSLKTEGLLDSDNEEKVDKLRFILTRKTDVPGQTPELVWVTKQKSKQHHKLVLRKRSVQPGEFKRIYTTLYQGLEGLFSCPLTEKRNLVNNERIVFDRTLTDKDELERVLRGMFKLLKTMANEGI